MRKVWVSWAMAVSLAAGPLALPVMAEAQQSVAGKWAGTARGIVGGDSMTGSAIRGKGQPRHVFATRAR
jgi:hypothetical protein